MASPDSKPVIAIDIDDVLATHAASFIAYSNEKFGTNLKPDDYQEHWADMWKVEDVEVQRRAKEYHDSGYMATFGDMDGAKEALAELGKNFKLVIITTRMTVVNQLTKDWLDLHYPGIFDEVVFSGFYDKLTPDSKYKTKGELAKEAGASYLIDDQPKHVIAAAKLGIKGLLFGDYGWNRVDTLPDGVVRVKDWKEVLMYFRKINA